MKQKLQFGKLGLAIVLGILGLVVALPMRAQDDATEKKDEPVALPSKLPLTLMLGPLEDASPHLRSIWQLVRDAEPLAFDPVAVAALEARAFTWLDDHPILLCPAAATPAGFFCEQRIAIGHRQCIVDQRTHD